MGCEAMASCITAGKPRREVEHPSPTVEITVTKNKLGHESVCASVGHTELTNFLSGEVRAVDCNAPSSGPMRGALSKEWKLQVVPHSGHSISISRANRMSSIVTVAID